MADLENNSAGAESSNICEVCQQEVPEDLFTQCLNCKQKMEKENRILIRMQNIQEEVSKDPSEFTAQNALLIAILEEEGFQITINFDDELGKKFEPELLKKFDHKLRMNFFIKKGSLYSGGTSHGGTRMGLLQPSLKTGYISILELKEDSMERVRKDEKYFWKVKAVETVHEAIKSIKECFERHGDFDEKKEENKHHSLEEPNAGPS